MLRNLKAEMIRRNISLFDVSKIINKSERCTRDKVSGKAGFTFLESMKIRDKYFPGMDLEYLFAPDTNQTTSNVKQS